MSEIKELMVLIPRCPLCGGTERYYSFLRGERRFDQCRHCGLLSRATGATGQAPEPADDAPWVTSPLAPIEEGLGSALFALLARYVGRTDMRLGILGKSTSQLLAEAQRLGFHASVLAVRDSPARAYDAIVAVNVLEEAAAPIELVDALRGHLASGGVLAVVTRQLPKSENPTQPQPTRDQRHSFSDTSLQTVLWKAGFADAFLSHHVDRDDRIRQEPWFDHQTIAFGRMHGRRALPRLSVIVPVYNEANTVAQVLDALAVRQIPGIELEIVVVESGSTDGSREIVLAHQGDPRFKIIIEERARGKGCAVRNGFRSATGDIILIQDADLEYDLLDYEVLIDPIVSGRSAFVLGTRHAGSWKIRKFAQNHLANAMNVAHWVFVFAMNQLYAQSMTDPFTMFKVFRADCLSGLEFECQRFDFDVELVCKLLRKGYVPLEIPVNYQSRSFEEGKKVRLFRDPVTWLRAMLKYRTGAPRQLGEPSAIVRALEQGPAAPRTAGDRHERGDDRFVTSPTRTTILTSKSTLRLK
jgi:hypothetical protein